MVLKITYILTRSDVIGGASVHLLDLAHGAQRAGHDVTILVGGDGIFFESAKGRGLSCFSLKYMKREIEVASDFLGFFEIRRFIKKLRPDIVHVHSSKAGALGRLACKSLSVPVIFTAHGWAFTEGVSERRRKIYTFIERYMAQISDKIITVSEYDRRLALARGVGSEKGIVTIHNGMPLLPKKQRGNDCSKDEDAVFLIMVARFDEPKDQRALVKALAPLKELKWKLELVGGGPLLEETRQVAEKLGLKDRVTFSGFCNDVAKRLERADIFVLISHWEGLPLTILEAMRAGLPVVASDVGGVSETIVNSETGFLVPRGNEQALTNALSYLIGSKRARETMGERGRCKFERCFTFEMMLKRTFDIYAEVLQEHI